MPNLETTTVVAMPLRNRPEAETDWCLKNHLPSGVTTLTEIGKPVDIARNALAARIRALDPRPDVTLWMDGDVWFEDGFVERFVARILTCDDRTAVGTVHCARHEMGPAQAWALLDDSAPYPLSDMTDPKSASWQIQVPSAHVPSDELLPVRAFGGHCLGHRTALLDHLPEAPWTLDTSVLDEQFEDPVEHVIACRYRLETSEDFAFCHRVNEIGRCLLDCNAFVGHVEGKYMFVSGKPVHVFDGTHRPHQIRNEATIGVAPNTRTGDYGKAVDATAMRYFDVLLRAVESPEDYERLVERLREPTPAMQKHAADAIVKLFESKREMVDIARKTLGPQFRPVMLKVVGALIGA